MARQHSITAVIAAIRLFGYDISDGASLRAVHGAGYRCTGVGKPEIVWAVKDAKEELVSGLVNDAWSLLGLVDPEARHAPWFRSGPRDQFEDHSFGAAYAGIYTTGELAQASGAGLNNSKPPGPNRVVRKISTKGSMNLGAPCRGCPFRAINTKAKGGRKVITIEHPGRPRAHRDTEQETEFPNDYRGYRASIKRSFA